MRCPVPASSLSDAPCVTLPSAAGSLGDLCTSEGSDEKVTHHVCASTIMMGNLVSRRLERK
eukprot:8891027-Heterocapsa_arctica.AAC.1